MSPLLSKRIHIDMHMYICIHTHTRVHTHTHTLCCMSHVPVEVGMSWQAIGEVIGQNEYGLGEERHRKEEHVLATGPPNPQ